MPEVYDPTGGSIFRPRRKRKTKAARPKTVPVGRRAESNASASHNKWRSQQSPPTSISRKKPPAKDPLEFDAPLALLEQENPRMKYRERKKRARLLLSNDDEESKDVTPMGPKTTKKRKADSLHEPSKKNSPSSLLLTDTPPKRRNWNFDTTTSSLTENFFQYATAFDTRYLDTQPGNQDQEDFQRGVKDFLTKTFNQRGFSSSVVTWTECSSSRTTNGVDIKIGCSKPMEDGIIDKILLNVNGLPIQSETCEKTSNTPEFASRLPNELTAKSTWNTFGNLVKITIDRTTSFAPLKVVIFTSAVSFLLDDNVTSHTIGIDAFWEKSQRYFLESKLQSVEIVMVTGETIIDRTQDQCASPLKTDSLSHDSDNDSEECDPKNSTKLDPIGDRKKEARKGETGNRDTGLNDSLGKQADILKKLQRYIESKVERDSKMNRSRLYVDSKLAGKQLPMKISISVVDDALGFHSLCQKWSRESLNAAAKSKFSQFSPTISFHLPETIDFDACNVSFATNYKSMPFRVDSLQAKQLYEDLLLLSKTELQVIQLVPIPSVDASLIYGVTIGLGSVHEDDEESHHEKNYLVQSLFNHLATRDCALLLRSNINGGNERLDFRNQTVKKITSDGLFHSTEESQYFLFMPEFVVSTDGPAAPKSGVLRRIASVDHILEEMSASDLLKTVLPPHFRLGTENSRLGSNPLLKYVEDSLDSLKCSPLNPWLQDRLDNNISGQYTLKEQSQASSKFYASSTCISKEQTSTNEYGQVAFLNMSAENEKQLSPEDGGVGSNGSLSDEYEMRSRAERAVFSGSKQTDRNRKTSDRKCESVPSKNCDVDKQESVTVAPTLQIHNSKPTNTNTKSLDPSVSDSPPPLDGIKSMTEKKRKNKNATHDPCLRSMIGCSSSCSSSSSTSSESSFGNFYY